MTGAMGGQDQVQVGMPVYGPGDEELGRVGRLHGDGFDLGNGSQHIPLSAVARVAGGRVYVRGGLDRYQTDAALDRGAATNREAVREDRGEVVVPVVEERLDVEKRPAELGEVTVQKNVTEERQEVPVELRREEVHVERRDVADRPLRPGEADLRDETIRVPVRGEEAVVQKEAAVTGEVVVDKTQTTQRQTVADTVRRQEVDVDEDYARARPALEADWAARQGRGGAAAGARRTWADAEPNYRYGYSAARDARYRDREFADVEPDLRRGYTDYTGRAPAGDDADEWAQLREEVRAGWERARG
ncbi:MAG TPA: DUF2382 domain-containing protein [Thermomicrobiales bacterium]|nr:DUF2382 domain-containing protein [Thermomicrobiales bacterium]